jgi:hypothetical protein
VQLKEWKRGVWKSDIARPDPFLSPFVFKYVVVCKIFLLITIFESSIFADECINDKGIIHKNELLSITARGELTCSDKGHSISTRLNHVTGTMATTTMKISSLSNQCYAFVKITEFEDGYGPSINNLSNGLQRTYNIKLS